MVTMVLAVTTSPNVSIITKAEMEKTSRSSNCGDGYGRIGGWLIDAKFSCLRANRATVAGDSLTNFICFSQQRDEREKVLRTDSRISADVETPASEKESDHETSSDPRVHAYRT